MQIQDCGVFRVSGGQQKWPQAQGNKDRDAQQDHHEPLRLTAWFGPHNPGRDPGAPGSKHVDYTAMDVTEGGTSVPYWMEDPHLRREYEADLQANGIASRMDPALYVKPDGVEAKKSQTASSAAG